MLKAFSALCGLAVLCTMPSAGASPETESFIRQNFDKGYMILNSPSLSNEQRRDQFRTLLIGLAASRRIALFTLGAYAKSAAPAELDEFVEAVKNYSVSVSEYGLNQYSGQ